MCVCVLTGLRNLSVWPNYDVVEFQASVSYCSIPRLCRLLLCTLPCPSWYSNPRHSYHTSSSTHLVVPRLRPSVSFFHRRPFSHLVVSRLRSIMPTTHPVLPLSSCCGFYRVHISARILLHPLASRESVRVARGCLTWVSNLFIFYCPDELLCIID